MSGKAHVGFPPPTVHETNPMITFFVSLYCHLIQRFQTVIKSSTQIICLHLSYFLLSFRKFSYPKACEFFCFQETTGNEVLDSLPLPFSSWEELPWARVLGFIIVPSNQQYDIDQGLRYTDLQFPPL